MPRLLVEGLGHVHGFLTGHGIHHQQNLLRLDRLLDAATARSISAVSICSRPAVSMISTSRPIVAALLDGLLAPS